VVHSVGEKFEWKLLDKRFPHADDQALGQAYEELYLQKKDPVRIADTKAILDRMLTLKDNPDKDVWWWCDALFMAPAAWQSSLLLRATDNISMCWTASGT